MIGHFNDYRFYFFEAIREMCERGIGKPLTPFQIMNISGNPLSSVSLSDFMRQEIADNLSGLTVRFLTPVILYRLKGKKNTQLSYQDKTNRFPSFYQLVRSSFARLQKLYALYVEPDNHSPALFDETIVDAYTGKSGYPLLKSANIQHISLPNTQKKGKKNEMPLAGYTGEQIYTGNVHEYIPLLRNCLNLIKKLFYAA